MDEPRSLSDIESIQSLDTARLALRWALEKIQSLEKDKNGLAEKLDSEERGRIKAQQNSIELQKTLGLRTAESSQRELYYAKLEEYLSLKLDGKLDCAALAKKEIEVSQLQEMLSQKQSHLEKDFLSRKDALERDYHRLKSELEAETREKIRRSEASVEAKRASIEQEFLIKTSELSDKKSELAAEEKVLAEKKARFEEYYNEQRAQLHAALKGFREEIKEEVSLRVQMAERILEERRESLEKVSSNEKSLLIRELESWKAKVKEMGPKVIDLDKALALSEEKLLQARGLLDRAAISRGEEMEIREAEKKSLLSDLEVWRKQVLSLLAESQSLKAALAEAQEKVRISQENAELSESRLKTIIEESLKERKKSNELWQKCGALESALKETSQCLEVFERQKKSDEARMKKELEDFVVRHEALTAEFQDARRRGADQMGRLVELEKEAASFKQAAIEAGLRVSRAEKEAECFKNERVAIESEMLKLRAELENSLKKSLDLERKIGELEEKLRQEEKVRGLDQLHFETESSLWAKERMILEAHLKGYQLKLEARVKREADKAAQNSDSQEALWPPIQWREK